MTDKLTPVRCGCGGEAYFYSDVNEYTGVIITYCECRKCGIRTHPQFSKENAIKAWNKAMGEDKVGELMEHIWRDKLDTREKIANLVERMLR